MSTIRKALITEFGDESKVIVVEGNLGDPSAKEVQVAVEFSGFSGADINMRKGVYPFQKKAPLTPGYCLVGRVRANGDASTRFQPGDLVASLTVDGAEAELVNLPEKYLVPVPSGVDLEQATALVLDWNTAYGMVMRAARVQAGQKVFVHGMSGAVGHAIMTLAMMQGAEVFGTASPRNHSALAKLGATPFSYSDKGWIDAMQKAGGVDAVFDALGFESFDESYSILRQRGVLVGYGMNLPTLTGGPRRAVFPAVMKLLAKNLAFWRRKKTIFYYISRDAKTFVPDLEALFDLLRNGKLSVPIKAVFPLEKIQDAHREWAKGSGMGSIVIRCGSS
jgi:NADPH:quinone reductase-like Zn-dependent oxidoreductase